MAPEDVAWCKLLFLEYFWNKADEFVADIDDGAYEIHMRYARSWAATLGLLILWGFPTELSGELLFALLTPPFADFI